MITVVIQVQVARITIICIPSEDKTPLFVDTDREIIHRFQLDLLDIALGGNL